MREPALLTRPGLLARYDLMDMLVGLRAGLRRGGRAAEPLAPDAAGGPGRRRSMAPCFRSSPAANWARLTDPWLANAHRAGGRSAA